MKQGGRYRRVFWLLLATLLLLPMVGIAQPPARIAWDHDGLNVTTFKCVVDGGTPSDLGLPTPVGTTYTVSLSLCVGVMVSGTHSVLIQSCNATICVDSPAIVVVKL